MIKSSLDKLKTTEHSILILPKASPLKTNLGSTTRFKDTSRSLNDSSISLPTSISSQRYRQKTQPKSFYNDRSKRYIQKSRLLSEKNLSFQHKPLTFSQRKKYQSQKTEEIVKRRQLTKSCQPTPSKVKQTRESALEKFHKVAANKYKKLLYGQQMVKINKSLLDKGIKRSMSERSVKKWTSPFKGQSPSQQLRGKPLFSKQLEPILPPGNPTQIKVLNLDRLFRQREGKLTNIVPLPVAKLSEVNSREYLIKAVKHQDKIHEVIRQYNNLLKMSQLEKTAPKLGVKGRKFTKSPTIEELMGLKMGPSKSLLKNNDPLLQSDAFIRHCRHFVNCVKQDVHLSRRILAGITREEISGNLSLSAFALFWQLFVSRTAKIEEKVEFLVYFFLPVGQERVQLSVMRLILEIMCKELPPIEKLDLKTDVLSYDEKSKIFLQALIRVLFGDLTLPEGRGMSRSHLSEILSSNPDACDLLIRLLQKDE